MKGMKNLSAGMPDFMKKWQFWVGIVATSVICVAGCAAGGMFDTSPIESSMTDELPVISEEDERKAEEERLAAEKKAEEERIAKEKEEAEKKAEEERQKAEAEAKRIEEEKKAAETTTAAAQQQSQQSTSNSNASSAQQQSPQYTGYCKDGTPAYGDPHARGKANSCYGHGGWVR